MIMTIQFGLFFITENISYVLSPGTLLLFIYVMFFDRNRSTVVTKAENYSLNFCFSAHMYIHLIALNFFSILNERVRLHSFIREWFVRMHEWFANLNKKQIGKFVQHELKNFKYLYEVVE